MRKLCRQCGAQLLALCQSDICFKCAEANVKKLFKEDPELKKAFNETVKELKAEMLKTKLSKGYKNDNN